MARRKSATKRKATTKRRKTGRGRVSAATVSRKLSIAARHRKRNRFGQFV